MSSIALRAASGLQTSMFGLQEKFAELRERPKDNAVVVVFIVAVAILLALSITMSLAVVIYCISKGYRSVSWFGPNGWKVWEMKVACQK